MSRALAVSGNPPVSGRLAGVRPAGSTRRRGLRPGAA